MTNSRLLAALGMTLLATPAFAQQTPALRLAGQARAQIDGLNADSAFTLLAAALRQSTTDRERLRGFTLLGITELMRGNQPAARQAFERAIRLDPAMRIDSLADLSTDVQIVFAQARTAVGNVPAPAPVRAALAVSVDVARDTTLAVDNPRLQVWVQPNARARVTTTIVAIDVANRVIFENAYTSDAQQMRVIEWPLRGTDGSLMAAGRYTLRIQATDSASGETTPLFVRTLRVARVVADTQAHPPALAASAFAPERATAGKAKTSTLVWGVSIAALILATPVMGNPTLNEGLTGDPTAYVVASGVAIGSAIGFIRGGRPAVLADNVRRNQQLREDDRAQRDMVTRANAAARARAPFRVSVEGTP